MDAHDLELEGADDATLAIHRRLVEQNHESQETRKEILAVYRDTWTEFYQWEPAWCDSRLKELAPAYPRFTAPIILPRAEESDDMIADDDPLSFSVTDYDGKDEMTLTCTEECIPASRIVPHPKYEACTPSMRAIKADKSLGNIATFIPYADEGFDQRGYLAQFRETAWQNRWTDNDSHLIMLEAVKLLVSEHSYTYEKIDSLREKIFLPVKSHNGLLWKMKQRDLLQWKTDADVLPPPPPVETNFLFDVNEAVDVFCPSMNCIEIHCMTHKEPSPPLFQRAPEISNQDLRQRVQAPCGPECFILHDVDDDDNSSQREEAIENLLYMFPDEMPCVLAQICRVSCYKVYVARQDVGPGEQLAERAQPWKPQLFLDDGRADKCTLSDFCSHPGPCNKQADCLCAEFWLHCRPGCRCDDKCALRSRGCRHPYNRCGVKTNCGCRKKGRECTPGVCVLKHEKKGNAIDNEKTLHKHKCHNIVSQIGLYPLLEVKSGIHGLGTFACSYLAENTAIGEYIAENIEKIYVTEDAARHRKLNYTFDLNMKQILDAATVGNETRYINHATGSKANVYARALYVNGEHRIIFYTAKKVKRGQELFFDYGKKFWGNTATTQSDAEAESD